ncbi:MAG: protein translocase subunit SecF [Chloroflexi bacterium]|nr:MAG: protein translocase subunit SecF [Chloroflexota bacterium]
MRIDLVSSRKWLFLISGVTALLALIVLLIPPALKPGIEFTSGSTMQLKFAAPVKADDLHSEFVALGHSEARIQSTGSSEFLIRTRSLQSPAGSYNEVEPTVTATPAADVSSGGASTVVVGKAGATGDVTVKAIVGGDPCKFGIDAGTIKAGTVARVIELHPDCSNDAVYRVQAGVVTGYIAAADTNNFKQAVASPTPGATAAATPTAVATPRANAPGERGDIEEALQKRFGDFSVLESSTVTPVVSAAGVRNASAAIVISAIFIMGYIAFAFASVPRPVRYATCAIIATAHDVIIVLGAFSLMGKLFGVEVNLMFITGLLTVIGFSVHDTIVVFDRIRENVRLAPGAPLSENVNAALVQTLGRSLNTSTTVLLTVVAMLLLGGESIREFLLVLLVGIISGTYSSIGVAAQLLVSWEEGDFARLFGRRRPASAATE